MPVKRISILFLSLFMTIASCVAQEQLQAYFQTDLVSSYLWRGQRVTGASVQPVVGVKWRGLNFYVWGNEQLSPPSGEPVKHEIDFFLKYSVTPRLTLGLKDVYVNTRGDGFFSFGSIPHAANGLDVLVNYNFGFMYLDWSTTIAGYDGYNHSGKRSYGSYLAAGLPFRLSWLDCEAQLGIVPYYCSRYDDVSDGFHVNMCAVKTSHTFNLMKSDMSLTPYALLMVNPSSRKAFFQVGARFFFANGS